MLNDKEFYYTNLSVIEGPSGFTVGKRLFSKTAGFVQVVAMSKAFPTRVEAEAALHSKNF